MFHWPHWFAAVAAPYCTTSSITILATNVLAVYFTQCNTLCFSSATHLGRKAHFRRSMYMATQMLNGVCSMTSTWNFNEIQFDAVNRCNTDMGITWVVLPGHLRNYSKYEPHASVQVFHVHTTQANALIAGPKTANIQPSAFQSFCQYCHFALEDYYCWIKSFVNFKLIQAPKNYRGKFVVIYIIHICCLHTFVHHFTGLFTYTYLRNKKSII